MQMLDKSLLNRTGTWTSPTLPYPVLSPAAGKENPSPVGRALLSHGEAARDVEDSLPLSLFGVLLSWSLLDGFGG